MCEKNRSMKKNVYIYNKIVILMRARIKRLLREGLNGGLYFNNSTGISDYDKLIDNKINNKYGEIDYMTSDEYMGYVSELQGTSKSAQYKLLSKSNLGYIINGMKSGELYNIPYIDYSNNSQEGRHRIVSANELSPGFKFPVLIVRESMVDNEDKYNEHPYYPYFLMYDINSYNHEGEYNKSGELFSELFYYHGNKSEVNNFKESLISYLESNLTITLEELLDENEVNSIDELRDSEDKLIFSIKNFTDDGNNKLDILEEKIALSILSHYNREMINLGEDDLIEFRDLNSIYNYKSLLYNKFKSII